MDMEDFVNFKLAQKLKEKGFCEQCLGYYTKDSNFYYNVSYGSDVEYAFKSFNSRPNHICGKRIDTPTISQVLKWLREKKKLFIEISCNYTDYFPTVRLLDSRQTDYIRGDVVYSTYEQAALAGIEYSLDNLI